MRNLKVMMAYNGTNYHGFQRQENALTIQEVVEKAVSSVLNEKTIINGCSRTDTGVHALEYCFSLNTNSSIPTRNFVRGVNGLLPDDISILSCEDAPSDFHARYSAVAKEYRYVIHNSESKNPFAKSLQYHYRRPIDMEKMQSACQHFLGTHDFKSFCSAGSDKINTTRTIYECKIEKTENNIILLVKGDGFLYNMIRIIVGTLLWINEGVLSVEDIDNIIEAKDRTKAGKTAQAHGLYLSRVYY